MSKPRDFYQISLKAILRNTKGQVLILKALGHGTFAGFYDLPGGRIDEDEFSTSLAEVLKREVIEETGLTNFEINENPVAVGRHCIKKEHAKSEKDIHVLYVFYEVDLKEYAVKISAEHEGFEWIDLESADLEKYFTSGILDGLKMYLLKK
jgi:8-oxo-dGTP pyrophosphatase MutT (NUDIX family)